MSKTQSDIGLKIKEVRENLEWPQQKIADAVGLDAKSISSYERGRNNPPLYVIKKIAEMTNIPLSYFVDEPKKEILTVNERITKIETEITNIKNALVKRKTQRISARKI